MIIIFLYDILLNNIHSSPQVIFWITTIGCIVVFALIALWLANIAITIATSIIGSYMVARGISFYVGKFPSERVVMDLISNQEWESLKEVILIYLVAHMGSLFIFGRMGFTCCDRDDCAVQML